MYPKTFHILSDMKTVRELDEKWHKLTVSKRNHKLAHLWESGLVIFDKTNTISISREQLEKILESWRGEEE